MSGIISDRCGGNPFYITAVIQQARELSRPMLEHHMGTFTRIKDPILNDFLKVWGQMEMEHIKAGKIKDALLDEYYHFSKRSLNEYKGYLGEIHMSQILLAAQRLTLSGKFFNYATDIKIPDFAYVNHRVRLSSGKKMLFSIKI